MAGNIASGNLTTGTVFNIQHFSVHDGPGIRTVVFLKGCPLRCAWCANPESQNPHAELAWSAKDCIGCKNCVKHLSNFDLHFEDEGESGEKNGLYWNQSLFKSDTQDLLFDDDSVSKMTLSKFVKRLCPTESLHIIGETKTVSQVLEEVSKDEPFYSSSGGGVTISGGEPLMQSDFSYQILLEAGRQNIHRAIETTGFSSYQNFEKVASELDYLLIDVKTWSSQIHKKWTGVPNELILENLEKIRHRYRNLPIRVRTPIIPGVNNNETEIEAIAKFVKSLGPYTEHELLKYHALGKPKYASLKRDYALADAKLSDVDFDKLKKVSEKVLELDASEMRGFI